MKSVFKTNYDSKYFSISKVKMTSKLCWFKSINCKALTLKKSSLSAKIVGAIGGHLTIIVAFDSLFIKAGYSLI